MVAIIKTGHSIRRTFAYNENKVSNGVAVCIGEGNYPMDVDQMSSSFKLNFLLKQLELNENVTRNSVHISLNFDPSEKDLSQIKLMEIANCYMTKIGFGSQPYLVYQHHDAGHPHIHIVSIKVRPDGKRIDMQNIGKNESETARKEIEKIFDLIVAESRKEKVNFELSPISVGKINYGKIQSKKAINEVLSHVLRTYKYSSLAELNAVLSVYNVLADRGSENSRVFKANGLVYRIVDHNGKPTGVPIKASDFYKKPTLKFLEEKFIENKSKKATHTRRIKNLIDLAFVKDKPRFSELRNILKKEGINSVLRTSDKGLLYGITYVDHITKCVFNGSALGKDYSAKAILERCEKPFEQKREMNTQIINSNVIPTEEHTSGFISNNELQKIIDSVLQPEYTGDYIPNQLKGKRKKRRKKGQSNNQ
ncbi:relaxase/mobilization nuclease domain-containing protein [Flavobacterium sp. C3NV]|uniref:relaxase/mobilization nuclease domain-containing protein n=1 Tax=Flavobacterium sp. C3NV TaxID=3393358 RepID=UPI00398FA487